jgi:hypothetical protein
VQRQCAVVRLGDGGDDRQAAARAGAGSIRSDPAERLGELRDLPVVQYRPAGLDDEPDLSEAILLASGGGVIGVGFGCLATAVYASTRAREAGESSSRRSPGAAGWARPS